MREFPLCTSARAFMQPAPKQMMSNGKWMRSRHAVGMLSLEHQGCLGAVEPARILELRPVDDDILVGGARGASNHQRRRIGPGLGHVVIDVGAADPGFFKD